MTFSKTATEMTLTVNIPTRQTVTFTEADYISQNAAKMTVIQKIVSITFDLYY